MSAAPIEDLFHRYITRSILKEGGERYTNDPADPGGETKWGITIARARAAGYAGSMRDLPYETAYSIYRLYFWTQPRFDVLAVISPQIASLMLDLGINRGPVVPVRWLQRSLNVLNAGATRFSDMPVDGIAGAMTRAGLKVFLDWRKADGLRVLVNVIESFAAVEYVEIAERNPSQEKYEYGWLLNRAFQTIQT